MMIKQLNKHKVQEYLLEQEKQSEIKPKSKYSGMASTSKNGRWLNQVCSYYFYKKEGPSQLEDMP